jgi:hypothetical protein
LASLAVAAEERVPVTRLNAAPAAVSVSTRRVSNCELWQFARAEYTSGYMCFNNPARVDVADGPSTQAAIAQLEARIQALEERVRELTRDPEGIGP